ncbi:hypothetical protein [Candidatus Thiosymbion oneisti]|uniref:hypothetical protein n=1 Tax=Candidatus Thiosymbion oneisti TaxID=589554 RepID=UPI00114CF3C5|nr:hypothetical protein [Candidatus Thiosymbion oneisti]
MGPEGVLQCATGADITDSQDLVIFQGMFATIIESDDGLVPLRNRHLVAPPQPLTYPSCFDPRSPTDLSIIIAVDPLQGGTFRTRADVGDGQDLVIFQGIVTFIFIVELDGGFASFHGHHAGTSLQLSAYLPSDIACPLIDQDLTDGSRQLGTYRV